MIRIVVHPQYGGFRRYPVEIGYPRAYGVRRHYGYRRAPRISLHLVGRPFGFRRLRPMPFGIPMGMPFGRLPFGGGIPIIPPAPFGPVPYGPFPFGPMGFPEPLIGAGMLPFPLI